MSLLTNLVAYWTLDEASGNAADSSGNGYTLTNMNTTSFAPAKINNGADFGALNATKYFTRSTAVTPSGGACSISMWVKLETEVGATFFSFFTIVDQVTNTQIFIQYEFNGGGGNRRLAFGRTKFGVGDQIAYNTVTLGIASYYHLVLTYDGATITGYVNGASIGTVAASGSGISDPAVTATRLGASYDVAKLMQGLADEVGVWSRALTSAEVTQLYNGGSGITYSNFLTRYWVGGTGNWDASTTTHWSYNTGGSGGAPVPESDQNVLFDGSSGGGTATITSAAVCTNLTFTGYTGTLAGSSALSVYGNLIVVAGMTYTHSGTLTFASTATGKTITTNAKTITSSIVFDGIGGGWTLQDALTCTGSGTLTTGSLSLNNFNTSFLTFSSSNSNTRILTMGSGTMTLTSTGTVWNLLFSSGMTLTPNTSTIKITNATSTAKAFSGGNLTYYNLWITGAGTGAYTIVGSNTFNDFKVDTPPHTVNFTATSKQTVASFTVNGTAGNLMTLQSTRSGYKWTLASTNTISCDYLSLQDSYGKKL